VNRRNARILRGSPDGLREVEQIHDDVSGQHDQGGWSQARFQRGIEKEKDDHLRDTGDALMRHFKRQPFEKLIVGGPREVVTDFEQKLHHYLRDRLAGRIEVDVERSNADQVLDPDPNSRELALGALGAIGGARVVLGLRDLWAGAAAEQRLAIVEAWALPATFGAGGERELARTAELGSGTTAVAAALELSAQAAGPDGLAQGVLARALRGADRSARLLALYEVPWADAELRALILEAQSSPDDATRLLSLWRQVEQGPLPAAQQEALRALAAAQDTVVGLLARATLARAGDSSASAGLLGDLGAPRARDRILAALALVTLQQWASAAHALGDDSPLVRQTVACQMLAEAPRGASETELGRAQSFGPFASKLTTLLE